MELEETSFLSRKALKWKKKLTLAFVKYFHVEMQVSHSEDSPHVTCMLVHAGLLITLKHTQTYTPLLV